MIAKSLDVLVVTCLLGNAMRLSPFVAAQDTCEFDFGTFQRGDSLGSSFETRCGSADDFPCFCNPDLDNQIECPYCGFATSTPNLLRCAADGQTIKIIDLDGKGQSCTCDASDPTDPQPVCSEDDSALVCTFEMDDGTTVTKQPGEETGLDSRCGDANVFPCICNPNLPMQVECPYCSYATNQSDTLFCLGDGETGSYIGEDGRGQECTCQLGSSPSLPSNSTCEVLDIGGKKGCTYTNAKTGKTMTMSHLELDSNVPQEDGSVATCQCLDGSLDCRDAAPTDDDAAPTDDDAGKEPTPSASSPTPRPNPLPTPTTPVEAPTLPPVVAISENSGATVRPMAFSALMSSLVALALAGK